MRRENKKGYAVEPKARNYGIKKRKDILLNKMLD